MSSPKLAVTPAAEDVIFVAGDDEMFRGQCCITDRENPWHAWLRAEDHCLKFGNIPWHIRMRAALDCRHMAEAIARQPRPPQRTNPIVWGWGKTHGKF